MKNIDRILTGKEKNYCMDCNYLSYEYGEIDPENSEGEAQVICPKCSSISYCIATDKEIKEYGN